MRIQRVIAALSAAGLGLIWACQSERMLSPVEQPTVPHPELTQRAARVLVDVEQGTVTVLPPDSAAEVTSNALLGPNEVRVTSGNFTSSPAAGGMVTISFDVAITNRFTSASLVAPTFPPRTTGSAGLLLFPLAVTDAVGASTSRVTPSADWNGDGTAGSGAPRNFFNDGNCPSVANTDCFRWEQFPAPLGPGQTTANQRVGFTGPRTLRSFTALLILAADIRSDLPAVARLVVTPPSYVMNNGYSAGFTAVAYDVLNNPLSWPTITWTSPDLTAVEFQYGGSLVGVITGTSVIVHGRKVGQTYFTASSGGVSVRVPIDIQVNTIVLVQPYIRPDSQLVVGEQVQAEASVKDNSGQIVPGFSPTWSSSDPAVATVDPATGLITATGQGFANIIATAAAASGYIPITVNRPPTGNISGTLTDLDGRPVAGVSVHLISLSDRTVTTNANGVYDFGGGLLASLFQLVFTQPYCVEAVIRGRLDGGTSPVRDIAIDCPPRVSGRVTVLQGGVPPAGLTVELTNNLGGPNYVAQVQPDGTYSASVDPGTYSISVNHLPASCTASAAQSLPLSQQTYVKDWTLDCPPVGTLTGTVRDFDGQDVVGATVSVQDQATGQIRTTTTNATGDYSLLLPPAQYLVTPDKPGPCLPGTSLPRTISVGSTALAHLVLECPWHLQGKVVMLGQGVPIGLVAYVGLFDEHANVLSDGSYDIVEYSNPNGHSGTMPLSLFNVPSWCKQSGPTNLTITQQMQLQVPDITLDCRPATVQILVTDGLTNPDPQPLIGAIVYVIGPTRNVNGTTTQIGIGFTNVEWNQNSLQIFANSRCEDRVSTFTVDPGATLQLTSGLRCPTVGALKGTITTALHNLVANVRVAVGPYTLVTDANGHWGVAGLPPGPTQVQRLDTPAGCPIGVPMLVAVIPIMTMQANETVACSTF